MSAIHIPTLAPEVLLHVGPIPVTNTMVNAWVAIAIFLVVGLLISAKVANRPGKLQNFWEYIIELILGYFDQVTGDRKKSIRFLPIAGSIFFFILLSNWLGLLPGTGSIKIGHNFLLRPANTDLNLTLAMALVSIIASHMFGFLTVGVFAHANKFVQVGTIIKSFKKGPLGIFSAIIEFGVGLIEIAGEVAKVMSLSLRLFGNIFAGEVLITVIASIISFLLPTPFMLLELLVGLIQAGVFAILSIVYMTVASAEPHGAEEH
jgi:F-type H+-transporting ATPase subunit a